MKFSFSLVYTNPPSSPPNCTMLMAQYKINDVHLRRRNSFNPTEHGVAQANYLHMLSAVSA